MATPVVMPKQGNSVESCIIVEWKRQVGDLIAAGDTICDVETDKAVLEVESPADGTLLALFFAEGDEVPVVLAATIKPIDYTMTAEEIDAETDYAFRYSGQLDR